MTDGDTTYVHPPYCSVQTLVHAQSCLAVHETTAATDSPQGEEDGEEMAGWDGLVDSDGEYDIL